MLKRQSFGRVVDITLSTWKVDEEARWHTMEEVRNLAETPYSKETEEEPLVRNDKGKGQVVVGSSQSPNQEGNHSSTT